MKNYLDLRTNDLDLSKVTYIYILPYYCLEYIYTMFICYIREYLDLFLVCISSVDPSAIPLELESDLDILEVQVSDTELQSLSSVSVRGFGHARLSAFALTAESDHWDLTGIYCLLSFIYYNILILCCFFEVHIRLN